MTKEQIEKVIGDCSEIINKALYLPNVSLRNNIVKHVNSYRQELRMKLE